LSRSLYVGTQTSARLGPIGGVCPLHRPQARPYDRRMPPLPAQRRRRGRARRARGRVGDPRRAGVPRPRVPPRGDADPRDGRVGRGARVAGHGEGAAGDRRDDRVEDRRDDGDGLDVRAREAPGRGAGGGAAVPSPPGASGRRRRPASGGSSA
jgi:hypothetical protein